jgi:hypothetical protein
MSVARVLENIPGGPDLFIFDRDYGRLTPTTLWIIRGTVYKEITKGGEREVQNCMLRPKYRSDGPQA